MNSQKITTNASSKAKPQTTDYISQIKKDTVGQKENKLNEVNDLDWEKNVSDDDEETNQTAKKVVIEQGKVGMDKPKKLRDLFDDSEQAKPKFKKHQTDASKQYKKVEGKSEGSYKPKFFNSSGVQQKESEQPLAQKPAVQKKYDKEETIKKFTISTNIISKAAEENAKIIPKTKDYLDGESKVTYKEEVAMEKPKFMSHADDVKEPRFVEIDKSEDLFLKKVAEKNLNLAENAYTEPKENKEQRERKPYQKREFQVQKEYKPRTYEKKKEEEEQVDSDGFTIVNTEKKRNNYNNEERPFRKHYEDREKKEYKGKRKYPFNKDSTKEEGETKEENKENVENNEEKKEDVTDAKTVKTVNVKSVVKISTGAAKSLKDLF